ncbi:uncharacterized protein LOC115727180 isoform X2 [Rhodamnia argentea]|uniref:Uncharacterized protein LOC115727180 isoform X2 n=1 Tax=Rhodamnia argentea TaxID=178133 RepID=A0ABM3GX45_9MYRT|nr:uncharacterized protein LOC115727180 isoform X2 [Rhodamnia argentea]
MAFYCSLWLLIESTLIPNGFRKWFYLSFFVHPFFLVACWVFLLLKTLFDCALSFILLPLLRRALFLASHLYGSAKCAVFYCFWSDRGGDYQNDDQEIKHHEVLEISYESAQDSLSFFSVAASAVTCKLEAEFTPGKYVDVEEEQVLFEDAIEELEVEPCIVVDACRDDLNVDNNEDTPTLSSPDVGVNLNEHVSSFLMLNLATEQGFFMDECLIPSVDSPLLASEPVDSAVLAETLEEDADVNRYSPSTYGTRVPPLSMLREVPDANQTIEADPFYGTYAERMGWFDILNHERTCGISAMLQKETGTAGSPLQSIESANFTIPQFSLTKLLKHRLLRSLQGDFELVYVAQACLSWEALNHHHQKVQDLAQSPTSSLQSASVSHHNLVGEFQKFQVLLERFLEDERCEGKRCWKYVQARFSLKSLLQVPELTAGRRVGAEEAAMDLKPVSKAIEKCIRAFYIFVKTDHDNDKTWWKLKSSLWSYSPVEDPRDIQLLADLNQTHRKKTLGLKDLQGKKRCWLKKRTEIGPLEESQRKEILLTLVDLSLVSRVLHMSTISSSQLKWCQTKLDSISFREGRLIRSPAFQLFPVS